jgi:threonyl-tRNA synthetase
VKPPFKSKQDWEYAQRKLGEAVGDVMCSNVRRATAFISPKLTIKATAQRRQDKRNRSETILVTVGAPNFVERRFIKVCQKAGMVFPLNQIVWKHWPKEK